MSYSKQNFVDGMVLSAAHLNHMEEGIVKAFEKGGIPGPQGPSGPQGPAYELTEADKAEIVEEVKESGVLMYTEQTLTEEQKTQSRANIGAASEEEWFEIADITSTEEVNSFYVNKDKNGNPFVCKRIVACMILPSALASGGDGVYYGGGNGIWVAPGFMSNNSKSNSVRIYDVSVVQGFFTEFRDADNTAKHFGTSCRYAVRFENGFTDLLTQFYVCRGDASWLYPVGTQLKVWGLKA